MRRRTIHPGASEASPYAYNTRVRTTYAYNTRVHFTCEQVTAGNSWSKTIDSRPHGPPKCAFIGGPASLFAPSGAASSAGPFKIIPKPWVYA